MKLLDEILEAKKEEVRLLRRKFTRSSFTDSELFDAGRISLAGALSKKGKINLIAEIKKASPSKGIIRNNFDAVEIANKYFEGGADAVSVLTDRNFFMGSIEYLRAAAKTKRVPLLRKDFLIDEFQILEARANGADAILLIAEALSKGQMNELSAAAAENGLEVLTEFHSAEQIEKLDLSPNRIIGINNRDLATFKVDTGKSIQLARLLPPDILIVAESGIDNVVEISMLKEAKINGVLTGEFFMRSEKIEDALKQFTEWCRYEN